VLQGPALLIKARAYQQAHLYQQANSGRMLGSSSLGMYQSGRPQKLAANPSGVDGIGLGPALVGGFGCGCGADGCGEEP